MKNRMMIMLTIANLWMLLGCEKEDKQVSLPEESYEVDVVEQETENRMLYFLSNEGYVVPKNLLLPVQEDRAVLKQSIEYLVQGGPIDTLLPTGLTAVLPENTKIRGINITDDQTAIIDLSQEFLNYDIDKETDILEALTFTATTFENVERIKIWVEGESLDVLPKQQTVMSEGYSRHDGINVLKTEAVDYLTTTPVTLYYPYYIANQCYFVPTTTYVPQSDNLKHLIVQSLIEGPGVYENVSHVVKQEVKVKDVTQSDDLLTVTLSDEVLTDKGTLTKNVIEPIVLTLTEFEDVKQVKLMVEGVDHLTVDQSLEVLDVMSREDVLSSQSF